MDPVIDLMYESEIAIPFWHGIVITHYESMI